MLWLWCRPAAIASIQPLAWEPPYVAGTALKSKKTNKQKKNRKKRREDEWKEGRKKGREGGREEQEHLRTILCGKLTKRGNREEIGTRGGQAEAGVFPKLRNTN